MVRLSQPGKAVYVNEIVQSSAGGDVTLPQLLPGTYRVLVGSLDISDRVRLYSVPVYPGLVTTLGIDWELDSVLAMEKWVGFQLTTGTELAQGATSRPSWASPARRRGHHHRTLQVRSGFRLVTRRYDVLSGTTVQVC